MTHPSPRHAGRAASLLVGLLAIVVTAQGLPAQVDTAPQEDSELATWEAEFQQYLKEFRQSVMAVQAIGAKYLNAPSYDAADPYLDRFDRTVEQGNQILNEKLIPTALAIFDRKTERGSEVGSDLLEFVTRILNRKFDEGQYEQAFQLADKLTEVQPDHRFGSVMKVRAGLLTNRFGPEVTEAIKQNLAYFQKPESLSDSEMFLLNNALVLNESFQRELELRDAEKQADDLPRVVFETSKGEFVIELFENEAPETVANFIELVEAGHYNDLLFHVVIDKTVAETGVVTADRKIRNVNYRIKDESKNPDIRLTFAGSVIMSENRTEYGSCRFFIALAALPVFNGKQTVFGRVISGMDTVYALNKTFKFEEQQQIEIEYAVPDRVISAKVLRKRDHEYKPAKLKLDDGKQK